MKTKFNGVLTLLLALVVQFSFAQERSISGVVSDGLGPISDITVLVKGTDNGTVTDFDGNYTINAKTGDIIVFSHISYQTMEQVVGASNTVSVTLSDAGNQLEEVIVTALGIKKEKKSLGYAVTNLNAEDIEERATGDIAKILRGKAAGVDIISASGLSGAASSVVLRGLTSFGNNQPLYVVDGVRFNSSTTGSGFNSTSRSLDIDPNNIASINVLKGLSASALYGSAGVNGVIVITTKAGKKGVNKKKKTEVTISAGTFINKIASLPEYTNERGQGYYNAFYNFFGNWGAPFDTPGINNINENGQVPHPYTLNSPVFNDGFPDQDGSFADYRNFKSQENFFDTGVVTNINVNVNGGNEKASFNLSVGNTDDEGFIPGNSLTRKTISIGGNADLTNKLNISSTLNYSDVSFNTPDVFGIFNGLLNTPRNIDLAGFPNQHPLTGEEISFQNSISNPYWLINNTNRNQEVNRTFGQISANYGINDNLSFTYRYGFDISIDERLQYENRGRVAATVNGFFLTSTLRETLNNHTFLLNYDNRFSDDKFGLSVNTGVDLTREEFNFNSTTSTEQTVYSLLEHQFFAEQIAVSLNGARNIPGIFMQFTFDINRYLYLTGSARNDWTSNFVDNSQFYPGLGLSFIPTAAFEGLKSDAVNFLKLRASFGSSASFGPFGLQAGNESFPINQVLGQNSNAFDNGNGAITTNSISSFLANGALGPALVEEVEFGIESKFWKNRINFEISYFNKVTSNLIFNRDLDPSTGFTDSNRNVNEFKVNGIEIEMDVDIIKSEDFSINIGGNFTTNESEVTELEEERFRVTGSGTVGNFLIEGEPVNLLLGTVIATDDDGNFLNNGRSYDIAGEIEIIGDPNPDFITSMFTAINYKNLTLTANLQYRKGGDIYSATAASLLGRGLTTDGDGLNNTGFVLPGINTDTGLENTVVISSGDALFNEYIGGPDQFAIFDGTTIRLQEVALRYTFSKKVLNKTPFGGLSISLIGENLYFDAINMPDGLNFDTNTIGTGVNSNGAGIDTADGPSSKRYGINLKLSF